MPLGSTLPPQATRRDIGIRERTVESACAQIFAKLGLPPDPDANRRVLAVIKVLVYDLSSLDALYRVGSVFILGLVFLLLAYLYHRQGRRGSTQPGESAP